ncbi:hypothetical protein COTS27_01490 [Spirochaetota bacterium]|nr:hypothetical protein COTS27_01490 [Spirochaetota bacterium]
MKPIAEKQLETQLKQSQDKKNIKILIVDDENVNVYILEKILFKYNMEYDSCSSGKEAIKKVEENEYDVVLLDVMLVEMTGFEVCEYIHKICPELPVIILTSLIDDDSIRYSFKYGAVDYIKKPINEVELLSRVENVIKIRSAERNIKKLYQDILHDLNLSSEIQKYLLPEWFVHKKDFLGVSIYEPSSKVSGDLYDILDLGNDKYLVYMGDISGHGVHAALLMTAVKSLIQSLVMITDKDKYYPHEFLTRLNAIITQTLFEQSYITILCSVIDLQHQKMTVYNAGHPPLLTFNKKTGRAQFVGQKGGCPLGWFPDSEYDKKDEEVFAFDEETVFVMYTDGVFECMNDKGEQLGLKKLLELIETNARDAFHMYLMPQMIKKLLHDNGFKVMTDDFALLKLENTATYFSNYREVFYINSFLINVAALGKKIEHCIKKWTDSDLLATKSELAVNEYLNNIISHGFKGRSTGTIVVEVSYDVKEDSVTLKLYDKGKDWNFNNVLEEKRYRPQDQLANSGRGILIIASIASRFYSKRYEDTNETVIVLIKDELEQEEKYLKNYDHNAKETAVLAASANNEQLHSKLHVPPNKKLPLLTTDNP